MNNLRVTPENITCLNGKEIFVFGSNEQGIHGAGAAKQALKFGASMYVGEGLSGFTYAIPTLWSPGEKKDIEDIEKSIKTFIKFAKANTDFTFLVTRIGCGLAHWEVNEIAPLFTKAVIVPNIHLPKDFWDYILSKLLIEIGLPTV